MTWTQVADVAAAICFVIGALLTLIAAIGILRFPDVLTRMHSAAKPQVLGSVLLETITRTPASRARALSLSLRPLDHTPVDSKSMVCTLRRAAAGLVT